MFLHLLLFLPLVLATNIYYTSDYSVNWFDPNNWSLDRIPNINDTVIIHGKIVIIWPYSNHTIIKNFILTRGTIFSNYNILTIQQNLTINSSTFMLFNDLYCQEMKTIQSLLWLLKNSNIYTFHPLHIGKQDCLYVGADSRSVLNTSIINDGIVDIFPNSSLIVKKYEQRGIIKFNIDSINNIGIIYGGDIMVFGSIWFDKYQINEGAVKCRPIFEGNIVGFNVTVKNELGYPVKLNVDKNISICV